MRDVSAPVKGTPLKMLLLLIESRGWGSSLWPCAADVGSSWWH